jgi:hypothetical protein
LDSSPESGAARFWPQQTNAVIARRRTLDMMVFERSTIVAFVLPLGHGRTRPEHGTGSPPEAAHPYWDLRGIVHSGTARKDAIRQVVTRLADYPPEPPLSWVAD